VCGGATPTPPDGRRRHLIFGEAGQTRINREVVI
jgi:hypothetical protein